MEAADDVDRLRDGVHGWLETHKGWLLLVDNVDDPTALMPGGLLARSLPPHFCFSCFLRVVRLSCKPVRFFSSP